MEPGTSIQDETRSALLTSAVAVLLMSQDYIASGLMEREFLELLDQAEHRDKYILWLQVGLFRSRRTERLKRYKKIGAGSPPLDQLSGPKRDAIYMDLANVIWKRLGECNRFPKPSSEET
jgi:hypothetical protein